MTGALLTRGGSDGLGRLWDGVEVPRPPSSRLPRGLSALGRRAGPYLMLLPAVLLLAAVSIYPLYYSLRVSLEARTSAGAGRFIGLDNYTQLLHDGAFWHSFSVTAIFAFVVVSIELLLGLALALAISPLEGRLVRVLRTVYILPMIIAPIVAGVIWRILLSSQTGPVSSFTAWLGLGHLDLLGSTTGALVSIMLVDIWEWTPFMFLILLAGIQSLPTEPYEAARVDGASRLRIFRTITLPMLRPVLLVAVLFRMIDAFTIFDQVYVLTGGGPGDSTNMLSNFAYQTGFLNYQLGYAATIVFAMTLVLAVAAGLIVLRLRRSRRWL